MARAALLVTVVWLVTCDGFDAVVTAAVGDSFDFETSVVIATASFAVSRVTVPEEAESGVVGIFLGMAMLCFFSKSLNSLFSLVAVPSRVFNS